jgi:hypothetical protein
MLCRGSFFRLSASRVRAKVLGDRMFASESGQTAFHWLTEEVVNYAQQPGQVERLFHQCGDSSGSCQRVLIRPRRYDDNLQQRMDRREPLEGFPAAFYRHVEIEQGNVDSAFLEVLCK